MQNKTKCLSQVCPRCERHKSRKLQIRLTFHDVDVAERFYLQLGPRHRSHTMQRIITSEWELFPNPTGQDHPRLSREGNRGIRRTMQRKIVLSKTKLRSLASKTSRHRVSPHHRLLFSHVGFTRTGSSTSFFTLRAVPIYTKDGAAVSSLDMRCNKMREIRYIST